MFFFFWGCSSRSVYILRYYVMIIYLPFLCCQASSSIPTIVINEGSIYQPASTRFLFLPSLSLPPHLYLTSARFIFFICAHPPYLSIHSFIHPSFTPTHPVQTFLFVSTGEGWDAACLPGAADSHPGCRRWPGGCQSLCSQVTEGLGLTHDVASCCLGIHFFPFPAVMCSQLYSFGF